MTQTVNRLPVLGFQLPHFSALKIIYTIYSFINFFFSGQLTNDSQWYYVYKIVLIFWIIFGLGYLVMILSFISQAMRCKKMADLERKLAQNLKHAHSKVLKEINRDVSSVRRLLNELYLLKYKVRMSCLHLLQ